MVVGVKDVAAAAGVSVGTVSNVLNRPERVSEETATRVQQAIRELGFVRNDAARQLRAGRSRSIGMVIPDIGNPFFAEVARGAEERAADAGLTVLLASSDESEQRQSAHLDLFGQQRVNGVLVTPAAEDLTALRALAAGGVPVVLVDREAPQEEFASVAVDDVEGGRLAAEHLLAIGRRRIAYVCGPLSVRQVADRLEGARAAVAQHPDAVLEVIERPALTVLHGRAAGESVLARGADARPDAVFAANDLLAVGLLQAFSLGGGVAVPEEIALIGYDDIDFASAAVVPLSSIRQPARLLGRTAVDLLLRDAALSAPGDTHDRRTSHDPASPRAVASGGASDDATADQYRVRFRPELVSRASTAP